MTTLTKEQRAKLREVVGKATSGVWFRKRWPDSMTIRTTRYLICTIHSDDEDRPAISEDRAECDEEDADYIEKFQPQTALSLLDALDAVEQRTTEAVAAERERCRKAVELSSRVTIFGEASSRYQDGWDAALAEVLGLINLSGDDAK